MKMRHRANPADPKDRVSSVPIDERFHVRILKDNEEKVFWLRKVIVDIFRPYMRLIFYLVN